MKNLYRVLLSLLVMAAMLSLANCGGSYGCRVTFGNSTCTPGTGGLGGGGTGGGGGGGGGGTVDAFAFAIDQNGSGQNGTIDGFALSVSGASFGPISGYTAPAVPLNSGGVGMVVAQKQFLYAGFGNALLLYGWSIGANGNLTTISGSPYPAAFLADFGAGVGQADMIVNPAGTLLFISATTASSIYVYQIGTGGALTLVPGSPFALPVGFTPMNLATDGLGNYLYAVDGNFSTHTGTAIAAFSIGTGASGSTFGALTPVQGSPFIGTNYAMWLLKGEPTGQFLVGTSGNTKSISGTDDDNLYVFAIAQSGANAGALTLVTKQSTTFSPYSIAVQSNAGGNLVYTFGFNDTQTAFNPVEGFSISSAGTLTSVGAAFTVGEGTWGQFDQSGAILMSYSSLPNASTSSTVTQLTPLTVGTGGALTQPASTLTLKSPGFWVVTDPQ